jgi:flagellin
MSSILTNNGAMVALQTLRQINTDMGKTQSMISTGKEVANAKDNAAVWAISKTMESEVTGLKAIGDSMNLGQSTIAVARVASEQITEKLEDMRGAIFQAQSGNMDRETIQNDVEALREEIGAIVASAEFNGLNLIDGSSNEDMQILASYQRGQGADGAGFISVERQSLAIAGASSGQTPGTTDSGANAAAAEAVFDSATGATQHEAASAAATTTVADGADFVASINSVAYGQTFTVALDNVTFSAPDGGGAATGSQTFSYVAGEDDSTVDVARGLSQQINAYFGSNADAADQFSVSFTAADGTNPTQLTISNGTGGTGTFDAGLKLTTGGTPGAAAGANGLAGLADIDVSVDPTGARDTIDALIETATKAAAAFGSAQTRIEGQAEFVSKLSDSLKSGIGSLVDADMEETSARLQALQVQQQLATQSLSIANQAPQLILALFR